MKPSRMLAVLIGVVAVVTTTIVATGVGAHRHDEAEEHHDRPDSHDHDLRPASRVRCERRLDRLRQWLRVRHAHGAGGLAPSDHGHGSARADPSPGFVARRTSRIAPREPRRARSRGYRVPPRGAPTVARRREGALRPRELGPPRHGRLAARRLRGRRVPRLWRRHHTRSRYRRDARDPTCVQPRVRAWMHRANRSVRRTGRHTQHRTRPRGHPHRAR